MNEIILKRTMYYDIYDKEFGDGFYPKLQNNAGICCSDSVNISFILIEYRKEGDYIWKQNDNIPIYGLDDISGCLLLNSLNKEAKILATKIMNIGGRIIYPIIPEQTTFKIIKEMKKRTYTI